MAASPTHVEHRPRSIASRWREKSNCLHLHALGPAASCAGRPQVFPRPPAVAVLPGLPNLPLCVTWCGHPTRRRWLLSIRLASFVMTFTSRLRRRWRRCNVGEDHRGREGVKERAWVISCLMLFVRILRGEDGKPSCRSGLETHGSDPVPIRVLACGCSGTREKGGKVL